MNTTQGETPMMIVSEALNLGGSHRSAYDYATLEEMLKLVGFVDIRRGSFQYGRDSVLLIDSRHRASESIYVEATAPHKKSP